MLNITEEAGLSLAEAAKFVSSHRPGKATHVATLARWITRGSRGVKLEALRVGGRWVTSKEAVQRFAENLTAAPAPAPAQVPTPAARRKAAEKADRELAAIGI